MPKRSDSSAPMIVALLIAAAVVLVIVFGSRLWGEDAAELPPAPAQAPAEASLDGVDLRAVHAQLLPAWISARSQSGAELLEERAFEALDAELRPNPALAQMMAELREHTTPTALRREPDRQAAMAVVRRWNEHLDEAEIPYLLRANIIASGEVIQFYTLSCEVIADAMVEVGSGRHRVRYVRRVDRLNLRETYLGMVREQEEGVIIILDEVAKFATDEVWPLLTPPSKSHPRDDLHAAFGPSVTAEALASLSSEDARLLQSTASARQALVNAVMAIGGRASCGSQFRIVTTPWNGYDAPTLALIRQAVGLGASHCPQVTADELDAIERASTTLRSTPSLRPAVEALCAWAAQPMVVHEARHAADLQQATTARERTCLWCGPNDPEQARVELSAYMAELAWTDSPALALFQACEAVSQDQGAGHGEALEVITERTDHGCTEGALSGAAEIMRALEVSGFGRSDPISFVGEYPERVPVDDLRRGG
ncbi:MAG: hypothetical protein K0V04_29640 [Deltaproteobacteria bacterium]|nr:hypothetical protein [Deltaproteobacteria bacterium]